MCYLRAEECDVVDLQIFVGQGGERGCGIVTLPKWSAAVAQHQSKYSSHIHQPIQMLVWYLSATMLPFATSVLM